MSPSVLIHAGELLTVSPTGAIADAAVLVADGVIREVGRWDDLRSRAGSVDEVVDGGHLVVTPGLVDSHTHLLEFGGGTAFGVGEGAQLAAAAALALDALQGGVTALGEHVLGHFAIRRDVADYVAFARYLPQTVRFAVGGCVVGTDPITCMCAVEGPGAVPFDVLVRDDNVAAMAALSQFPGENVIITASPANLPTSAAPLAGGLAYEREVLARIVDAYHAAGQRIGAHLEGDEAADRFLEARGDVIHHGHGLSEATWARMAAQRVSLCATPVGGTSRSPNRPEEVAGAATAGVEVSVSTDAVLPPHPDALWLETNERRDILSSDLLVLACPAMRSIVSSGAAEDEALALVTRNPARLIGVGDTRGTIEVGRAADLTFWPGIPGTDVTDGRDVRAVMVGGAIVVGGVAP